MGEYLLGNITEESVTTESSKVRDVAPRMSFGSIIGMGLFLATYIVGVELYLYWAEGDHTRPFVPMDLKESDVLAALAAVAAGTIALQIMAQGNSSTRSVTMEEYNHRMLIAYLAVGGTAASCTLALSSLAVVTLAGVEEHLAYLFVVVLLAAMNSLIAADAAGRIVRVEFKNPTIRVIAATRVSNHYNKLELDPQLTPSWLRRALTCLWQVLALGAVAGMLDLVLTAATWDYAPGVFFGVLAVTTVLLPLVRYAGLQWHNPSLIARIAAPVWLLMTLVMLVLVVATMDPENAILHQLVLLGVPTLLSLLGLLRSKRTGGWILLKWVPGAFIRESVYRKIYKDAENAAEELKDAKEELEADRPQEQVVEAKPHERRHTLQYLILKILATKRE